MKNRLWVIVLALGMLMLSACGGNVREMKTYQVDSAIYSQEEIAAAVETIRNEFRMEWDGCTLTELYYAGDTVSQAHQQWADRNGADEVLVLLSSFDVDASGGDGSLNPDSTYANWMWILVRSGNGPWQHVDHGY